jgi:hypothetical protein
MTESQKIFYSKLTGLAGMVPNFTLKPEIIDLYDQHLGPLGYDRVCKALDRIVVERNSRDPFPSIKEIRMIIDPELDPDQEAMVIASRIVGTVSRIGPYQTDLAKQIIGEVGWRIVQSEGGWENVCQTLTYENQGTLKAQWRNLAKTFLSRAEISSTVSIEHNRQTTGLKSFDEVFKSIPSKNIEEHRGDLK